MTARFNALVRNAQDGSQGVFTPPNGLPMGLVGAIGMANLVNLLTTGAKTKLGAAPCDGVVVTGLVAQLQSVSGASVAPEIRLYVADASGNEVAAIIPATALTGVLSSSEGWGSFLAGAATYTMTEGQTLWIEVVTGATATTMLAGIDALGYYRQ